MRQISFILVLVTLVLVCPTNAQTGATAIFFIGASAPGASGDIYRILDGEAEPEHVGTQPFTDATAISGDKQWIAFVTFLGAELFSVNENAVTELYRAVINPSVPTRMNFQWLPDSSGVVLSILNDPSIHGLTYGGILEVSAEFATPWPWLACDQIMQNRGTGQPGLVCGYPSDAPRVETPEQIVVHWGQEAVPFDSSDYLPLVGRSGQPLPPYVWFKDGEQETIILYGSVAANTSPDFNTVSTGTAVRPLLPSDPGRQAAFDVSSDHQRIAVISRNVNSDGLWVDCLRVYSIATGAMTWGGSDEACSPAVADPELGGFTEVAWYPNINQIVIAGRSPEQGAYLRRVNLDSDEDTILLQGYEVIEHVFVNDVPLAQPGAATVDVALGQDRTQIARIFADSTLQLLLPGNSEWITRLTDNYPMTLYKAQVAWSPDNRQLAAGIGSTILRFSLDENLQLRGNSSLSVPHMEPSVEVDATLVLNGFLSLEYSPNGNILMGATVDSRLFFWNDDTGELILEVDTGISPASYTWIDSSSVTDGYYIYDLDAGVFTNPSPESVLPDCCALSIARSPDDHLLALGFRDGSIAIVDARTLEKIAAFAGVHEAPANALAWDPDGSALIVAGGDHVSLLNIKTGEVQQFTIADSELLAIDWAADGTIAVGGVTRDGRTSIYGQGSSDSSSQLSSFTVETITR